MSTKRFLSAMGFAAGVTGALGLVFAFIIYFPELTLTAFLIFIFLVLTFLAY